METSYLGEKLKVADERLPKVILVGTRVAPYHPLGGVEGPLSAVFERDFEVEVVDGFRLGLLDQELPCLVIGYEDIWDRAVDDGMADEVLRYVVGGGGLLLVHNGICWANHSRLRRMIGARFVGHPEQDVLEYSPCLDRAAPIAAKPFRLYEEPYQYEFERNFSGEVFLSYEFEGRQWEAGWAVRFGKGRVICLQPGHLPAVFENERYAALLRRCGKWCSGFEA